MASIQTHEGEQPNIVKVLERTLQDALALGRAEIALAKREALEQAVSIAKSAVFLAMAVMFLQAALTLLGVFLIMALGAGAAGAAVVFGFVGVAAVLALVGVRLIKSNRTDTAKRVKVDAAEIAGAVK